MTERSVAAIATTPGTSPAPTAACRIESSSRLRGNTAAATLREEIAPAPAMASVRNKASRRLSCPVIRITPEGFVMLRSRIYGDFGVLVCPLAAAVVGHLALL